MGTGKQYDEEFKKQAIKLASFKQLTSGSKSLKRKTVSLKSLMNFWSKHLLFSSEVRKEERLKFISQKTDDGRITGRISFYCKALEVTRQAFYDHLSHKNAPWKYQALADEMMKIHEEDQYNDCYGRERMYLALQQRKDAGMLL